MKEEEFGRFVEGMAALFLIGAMGLAVYYLAEFLGGVANRFLDMLFD